MSAGAWLAFLLCSPGRRHWHGVAHSQGGATVKGYLFIFVVPHGCDKGLSAR